MTDKEWIEQEIEYIEYRLNEIKVTCDKPGFKQDNLKRLREIAIKIDSLKETVLS